MQPELPLSGWQLELDRSAARALAEVHESAERARRSIGQLASMAKLEHLKRQKNERLGELIDMAEDLLRCKLRPDLRATLEHCRDLLKSAL